jgi:hypothetical protein
LPPFQQAGHGRKGASEPAARLAHANFDASGWRNHHHHPIPYH